MNTFKKQKFILHVDMDAFFASVEQLDHPEYRGKPVIVGSDPKKGKGRGVVSACSYEARKFGVHSALPISKAYCRCPHGVFVPVNMKRYAFMSSEIFKIFEKFTPDFVPVSIDEAFLDITGSYHLFGTPVETCGKIKQAVKKETGLIASIGMAPNMMTAKIASDLKKPDGLVVVEEKDLLSFLHPLPAGKLWGVGAKTLEMFKSIGINTIGDIARLTQDKMESNFGKHGKHLWKLSNGIDPRIVAYDETVKSISNEYTFNKDTNGQRDLLDTLMCLSEKVSGRLRRAGLKGKTISLKIRFEDFKTYTRAITLNVPTNFINIIYDNVLLKANDFGLSSKTIKPVRLIGVKVSNFSETSWQDDLFEDSSEKKERLHQAIDKIRDRFGEKALRYRN